jgi:hypothetical protein
MAAEDLRHLRPLRARSFRRWLRAASKPCTLSGWGCAAPDDLCWRAVDCVVEDGGDKSMDDLRPHLVDEIKAFFIDYNRLRERKFKPLAESSPRKARKLIRAGMETFKKQSRLRARSK